jgi:mannitol-1-phosphate/altronate dehydrogenase
MSCDNVQQNGEVTKKCILQFAKGLNNPELIEYIENKVTFPNAMGKKERQLHEKKIFLS